MQEIEGGKEGRRGGGEEGRGEERAGTADWRGRREGGALAERKGERLI